MSRTIIATTAAPPAPPSYSQAVKAAGLVFVSGTAPIDPKTGKDCLWYGSGAGRSVPHEYCCNSFVSTIVHWLDEDLKVPRKQRHTAKRVFDRLRDERRFTGVYTIIKDYMRERDQRRQQVFVPLAHPPATVRLTSVKRWWRSAAWSGRRTSSCTTCRIATAAVCGPIRRRHRGLVWMATSIRLPFSGPCRDRSFTTTPFPRGDDPSGWHTQAGNTVQRLPVPLPDPGNRSEDRGFLSGGIRHALIDSKDNAETNQHQDCDPNIGMDIRAGDMIRQSNTYNRLSASRPQPLQALPADEKPYHGETSYEVADYLVGRMAAPITEATEA